MYDGGSTSDTQLGKYHGINKDVGRLKSSSNKMTLCFHSNGGLNYEGLDLTVRLISPAASYSINGLGITTGGTLSAMVYDESVTTALENEVVTLTATPNAGYVLTGISVKDANLSEIAVTDVTWYNNTAEFTMPASAVTVSATFTNELSSLSINMPVTGTIKGTIPAGVTSFKVYDNGGPSGFYSTNCAGTLELTAPTGCVLQLTGTVTSEGGAPESLFVYEGMAQLGRFGSSSGESVGTLQSSSNQMNLLFKSDESRCLSGLDLTVSVIDPMAQYNINGIGGNLSAIVDNESATTAKENDVVTLTATPDAGYVLKGITVTDENSNVITVTGGAWYNNTATFTMSASAVTVSATFTNDLSSLSINMPVTGTTEGTIPAGVTTFKVYDDGGSAGNYSNNCDGILVLTAPDGYVLQLTGEVTTDIADDFLQVYDGNSTSATQLGKFYSDANATAFNIGTLLSSSKQLTLYFQSNASGNYEGLNLTLTVVKQQQLTLRDNDDNTEAISDADGNIVNVTLSGRTLYKDGAWNTLCLPFNVTLNGSPLEGAIARPLTEAGISGTTLNLTFGDAVTELVAGTPYIIKWENGDNIVSPVFEGVTIDAAGRSYDTALKNVTTDQRVRFVGTYNSTAFTAADRSILLMDGGNKLYYPTAGGGIGAQRAYFKIGDDGATPAKKLTAFNIDFDEDGDVTGIISVSEWPESKGAGDGWYNFDGRQLTGKPSQGGVYINNGRKVFIK